MSEELNMTKQINLKKNQAISRQTISPLNRFILSILATLLKSKVFTVFLLQYPKQIHVAAKIYKYFSDIEVVYDASIVIYFNKMYLNIRSSILVEIIS